MKNKTPEYKNKMSQAQLNRAIESNKAIIELEPGKIMPLLIYVQELEGFGMTINFMASILHNIPENTVETRGRFRYASDNKTIIQSKKHYPLKDYSKAEQDLLRAAEALTGGPIKALDDPLELRFAVGEDLDEMMRKIDESDYFDIGTIHSN